MPTTQQKISTPLLFFSLLIFCALLIPAVSIGMFFLVSTVLQYVLEPYPAMAPLLAIPLLTAPLNHLLKSPTLQLAHLILNGCLLLLLAHSLIGPGIPFIGPILCALILLLTYHSPPNPTTPTTSFVRTSITTSISIFATLLYSSYFAVDSSYRSSLLTPLCAALLFVLAAYFHFRHRTPHQFSVLSLIITTYLFLFLLILLIGYWRSGQFSLFVPYRAHALVLHAILLYPTYKLFSYVREHPKYMTSTAIF